MHFSAILADQIEILLKNAGANYSQKRAALNIVREQWDADPLSEEDRRSLRQEPEPSGSDPSKRTKTK